MKTRSRNGGVTFAGILSLALIASLALNVAFVSGCVTLGDLGAGGDDRTTQSQAPSVDPGEIRLSCMCEVARTIGVEYAPGMTASDILSKIKMTVKPASFSGKVLTEKEIEAASDMLAPAAGAVLRENQGFLSDIKGKKILIISTDK